MRAISLPAGAGAPLRTICGLVLALVLALGQTMPVAAKGAPDGFADLAAKVSPAVVDITTTTTVAASTEGGPSVPPGSPFEQFFRDFMNHQGLGDGQQGDGSGGDGSGGDGSGGQSDNGTPSPGPAPQRSEALGSGFVISEDGFIVTNNHVIDGADDIQIQFLNGDSFKANVVGIDKATDIALLKIKADKPLPFVPFGDSEQMRVGDWVMAMGNPLGQGFSVTAGIVSAKGRTLNGSYRQLLPDRCLDQPGQLWRAAVQYGRAGHRGEYRDPVAQWRLDRDRLLNGLERGVQGRRPVEAVRRDAARLARGADSGRDAGYGRCAWPAQGDRRDGHRRAAGTGGGCRDEIG